MGARNRKGQFVLAEQLVITSQLRESKPERRTPTPGPWRVMRDAKGNPFVQIGGDGSADVYGVRKEENARLIAAAPGLWRALVIAVELLDTQANREKAPTVLEQLKAELKRVAE